MRAFQMSQDHGTRGRRWFHRAGAVIVGALALYGCGGPPAGYPDTSGVVAAQGVWCESLAKTQGGGDTWEPMSACKAAYPTASGPFLKGMAKCWSTRLEGAGNDSPDSAQIVSDCTDEVVVKMKGDDSTGAEVIEARCKRAERCEKVPIAECKAAIEKLEASQRALFTTRFNAAALHKVAGCLDSESCSTESEEAVYDACYKKVSDDLLWFPK